MGFILLGALALGLSRALLIAWQWERVAVTDSVVSMLVQGLRSDLITLGHLRRTRRGALAAATRYSAGSRGGSDCAVSGFAASLVAIMFLEFATPQFLIEYDSRPNRLFIEYLVYPREVLAMLWNGYRSLLLLIGRRRRGTELARRPPLHAIRSRRAGLAIAHRPARLADRPRCAVRDDPLELSAPPRQPRHVCVLR